jgi:uncharacterized membrane protein YhaH (DUF805 family)
MSNMLFGFQGRLNRAKWWLVLVGILVVEAIVFSIMGGSIAMSADPQEALANMGTLASVLILVFGILLTWVSLAVGIKRFHDRNKSGWWILIAFVPIIGGLWYLIECGFLRGTSGPNTYGPDPLGAV